MAAAALAEQQRLAAETKRQLDVQQATIAAERKAAEEKQSAERAAFEEEKRAFQAKLDEQTAADERRKQENAAAAEADRMAAMPTERVAEILNAAPVHIGIDLAAGPCASVVFDLSREGVPEVAPCDAIDDLFEIEAFRHATRDLLATRTAEEITLMLSEEIERFMLVVA